MFRPGGWMAAEVAVRTCERIATMNLIAPFGVRRKGVPFGDIFMWTPEENLRHRLLDQALAEQLLTAARTQSPETATAYLKDRYATARLCWHPRFHNPELERWLPRIVRPLQLIWGDCDRHRRDLATGAAAGAAERNRAMRSPAPARASAGDSGKNPDFHQ